MTETGLEPDTTYKVGRMVTDYDLAEFHETLPERWLGTDGEGTSLRDLADAMNVSLVRRALESAGEDPLEGEATEIYRRLTDDEVSPGVRTQQRNRLRRAGVEIEQLEDAFVSHQAIYTYLTEGLGVSKERPERKPLETHDERIQRLRSRVTAVAENSLSELSNGDNITAGRLDVLVDIQVYCAECQVQTSFGDFLERTGCDCE